jgi:transcriptional regulator with XRE-family HTH domain
MTGRPERLGQIPTVEQLAKRIRACCMLRGWDEVELAERSGVSRTTLYHLRNGNIKRPRITTLTSLAEAFEMPLQRFFWGELDVPDPRAVESSPLNFDRRTNTKIQGVCDESPELFSGWGETEWEELFSTFGVGGELSEEGVRESARRINRNREARYRLTVVMETHLREVAAELIDALYKMVTSGTNLEPNDDLERLLASHPPARTETDSPDGVQPAEDA